MIDTTRASSVVRELPVTDPAFRVEPQAQLSLIAPSSLRVFGEDENAEVHWVAPVLTVGTEQARQILDQVVAASKREAYRNSNSARARINYGVALLNAGMIDDAAQQFETAHVLDRHNLSVLAHLARVRLLEQRVDDARDLGNQVRELDPSNILGALLVASAAMIDHDPAGAIDVLKDAARLAPENWTPEYLLGLVYIRQRQAREAIRHLRLAARNQPRSAAVQQALGVAFGLQAEWGKAIRAFREALTLAPRQRESVLALAHVFLRQLASDDAIAVLSDWAAESPPDREIQELLAHAYRASNNNRAAKRHLRIALQATPDDGAYVADRARILNNIGVCAARAGESDEAKNWYLESIRTKPTMVAFHNLARAYRELGDLKGAAGVLEDALSQNPADMEAKLLHGLTVGELGDADQAIESLTELIDDGHCVAEAYAGLGWILSDEKRDYATALSVLTVGNERFPSDSVIANNLAYVNLMLGDIHAARRVLNNVRAEDVSNSVFLTATMGLLRLYEGDFEGAANRYKDAEQLARRRGHVSLAKEVRQKMHLEFARAFLNMQDHRTAQEHIRSGLAIAGRRSYHHDLGELRGHLLGEGKVE